MNENQPSLTAWRDQAPDPSLRAKILDRAGSRSVPRKFRFVVLGLVGSGALAVVFSVGTLVGTAPMSLGQVISADAKAGSITITNRRIMGPEKGNGFTFRTRSVGSTTLVEVTRANNPGSLDTIGYSDGKETITYYGRFKLCILDEVQKHFSTTVRRPKISDMLKDFKHAKMEQNVEWNGRKVTRFSYKAKLRNTDIDEYLLADPKTNLPIKHVSMRDNGSWGDEYLYDYSDLDASKLRPTFPQGTSIFDNRLIRPKLVADVRAATGPIKVGMTSPYEIALLVDAKLIDPLKITTPFTITIKAESGKAQVFKAHFNQGMSFVSRIDGHDYAMLDAQEIDLRKFEPAFGDKISGKVSVAGKEFEFKDLTLIKGGAAYHLNIPFIQAYSDVHPSKLRSRIFKK